MKKIKKVLSLLRINWRTMAEFEILYKFLSLCIFTPVFLGIFMVRYFGMSEADREEVEKSA